MSSNALAILPSTEQFTQMKEIASMAIKSGLLPNSIKTAEAATIIALKGHELGLPPMIAFAHINVIQGKACCSSELMLAHIRKDFPKAEIVFAESTDKKCLIKAKRKPEDEYSQFEMTFEQAYAAGFAKQWDKDKSEWGTKDNWKKQPKTMLRWRMVSEMKRFLFPEVLMGLDYTPEELEDLKDVSPREAQPATQDEVVPVQKIKNHAPQSAEEAANWKSNQSKPSDAGATQQDVQKNETLELRQTAIKDLREIIKQLSFDQAQVAERCNEYFGKTTDKLTNEELKTFTLNLWEEFNSKNKGAANE